MPFLGQPTLFELSAKYKLGVDGYNELRGSAAVIQLVGIIVGLVIGIAIGIIFL